MYDVVSKRLKDTERAAAEFVAGLSKGDRATVVGLSGDLGSGKTAFVKGAARALGVEETVTSPTFVIEKVYRLDGQQFSRLVHVDAYRLESAAELATLGFAAVLSDPDNVVFVEWPERVANTLPEDHRTVTFSCTGETARHIQFS